jgi:NAD(P)-dependent dehydrogenase (short-subunit alcohol dehydrogenase family)
MIEKIAIVTGGGRGIGAATARLLAQRGYLVCVNYRKDQQSADMLVNSIKEQGGGAIAVQADVSDEAEVERLFQEVDQKLGRVQVLVNNAGIVQPQMRVDGMNAERVDHMLKTNVTSYFLCCREAVLRMSTRHGGKGGTIVNVSSAAARLGSPGEYVDYAASKAAVDALTKGLALEVATEGIRVNCVRPGVIDTEIHASGGDPGRLERIASGIPMKRGGTTREVANAIAWLVSCEASYVTGAFLDVAGGR